MTELLDIVRDDTGVLCVVTKTYLGRKDYESVALRRFLAENTLLEIGGARLTLGAALGLPLGIDWIDKEGISRADWAYRLWHAATHDDLDKIDAIMKGDA